MNGPVPAPDSLPEEATSAILGGAILVFVPGLGAFLHVTFRAYLKDNGVDYRKVTFVEAAFPQHTDLLRGGSVDAVVSADPFMSRITESGASACVG